ncbi:MAG: NAD(P)H-dependent oxidoreductase subunit E [Sphingobacteriales bacterium]|jgi:NADH:ubiquinone oxidoreductase subunit F (NADH-binding)/NADH:ubiquinone oxidoreductase subunit E|nr:NAD(P)H-dependent oxidoreductase subunit E [Sphingobacteriales bacterium]MBP9140201.1 NAD(P)H-dependent oxidoreductase subunit E [Chitinophagales bacterium]MDA0197665.1 NAD(P)H-dependent oxidoreductase subunit E [Bacteroidota bacterium]MBK6888976.1 NAD(P)H-dependent oxidoreductase subunit E [Sphingobacteriales bacterium]MBK7528522.1 NAD(P)H-dependent oxidoreductase subunit E [Sphingobacteriales bacterium]
MSKNLSELSGRKGLTDNLFEKLGTMAKGSGSPDVAELEKLADNFLIGKANVYGSATFYDFTRPQNKGKKIYVCNGSACLTAGTQPAVKQVLQQHFTDAEIGEMCCLGRCHQNHAFHYNGHNYSGNAINEIQQIKSQSSEKLDSYHVQHYGTRILTKPFIGINDYYQTLKKALHKPAEQLLNEVKTANVRGRGGAGFPMGFKMEACKNAPGATKFVVCNADEGDPGAYSDRYLLEQQPHSVLLGMLLSGYMIGANWGVVYIRAEYPEAIEAIENALVELYEVGLCGENILQSEFSFDFKLIKAQGAYICGEETALLSSIEGQRPEVRVRPPYPAQQGLFNKPTIVNNVETLACVPYIIEHGGQAFAKIGTEKSKGTKLVCLDGHFNRPGLYEVDMGTPLTTVVNELGGGFKHAIKAMHIGGPLGGLVPVHKIPDLSIDFESFQQVGFLLGHASIVCIPEDYPLIQYLEHLFEFTAHESCGKCFPCRIGSVRGAELLNKAQHDANYKIDKLLFTDLVDTMQNASLCALGGGLPLPIKNAMQYFKDELAEFFE